MESKILLCMCVCISLYLSLSFLLFADLNVIFCGNKTTITTIIDTHLYHCLGDNRKVLQGWLQEGGEAAIAKGKVSFKIKYFKYDWSHNGSPYNQFKGTGKGAGCIVA